MFRVDPKKTKCIRFEVFKLRKFFPNFLVGVVTYKLDTRVVNQRNKKNFLFLVSIRPTQVLRFFKIMLQKDR